MNWKNITVTARYFFTSGGHTDAQESISVDLDQDITEQLVKRLEDYTATEQRYGWLRNKPLSHVKIRQAYYMDSGERVTMVWVKPEHLEGAA
jgi:hypothetical protein